MPPRLPIRLPSSLPSAFQSLNLSAPSFLLPSQSLLQQRSQPQPQSQSLLKCQNTNQTRAASILSALSDNPGAYNRRIRRGRGPASGKGKTSGRGHKGQKQHGKVPAGFTGGQTPVHVVHGSRGFDNIFTPEMSRINLDRIQDWIDQGRIDPSQPITIKELVKTRCIHGIKDGVKLLARGGEGALKQPINIITSRASGSAIKAVEAIGGSVVTRYYTRHAIKRILSGKTDPYVSLAWQHGVDARSEGEAVAEGKEGEQVKAALPVGMGVDKPRVKGEGFSYRLPDPTSRKDIEYYRDSAHRGYLSYLVGEKEGPSLFFTPPSGSNKKRKKGQNKLRENRIW